MLEALEIAELGIGEALGAVLLSVFNDADADAVAALEKFGNGVDGGIVGQVA